MNYLADVHSRKVPGLGLRGGARRTKVLWPAVVELAGNTRLLENLVVMLKECAAPGYSTISARSVLTHLDGDSFGKHIFSQHLFELAPLEGSR